MTTRTVPPGPARTVPWRDQAEPSGGRRRWDPVRGLQTASDLGWFLAPATVEGEGTASTHR